MISLSEDREKFSNHITYINEFAQSLFLIIRLTNSVNLVVKRKKLKGEFSEFLT